MNNHAGVAPDHAIMQGIIRIGRYMDRTEALYDLHTANNLGVGVIGMSGAGKTYTLKQLIHSYYNLGTQVVILDVHGDYDEIPGIPSEWVEDIWYGYTGNVARINPLHVEANAAGGLYIALKQFIHIVSLFNPSFGSKQRALMQRAVKDVYEEHGFDFRDEQTWGLPAPTLQDLKDYLSEIRQAIDMGVSMDTFSKFRQWKADENAECIYERIGREVYDLLPKTKKEKEELGIESSEKDRTKEKGYDPKHRLKWDVGRVEDAIETISTMIDSGLFGMDKLNLKGGKINRVVLNDLHETDQQALIHLIMSRLFNLAYRTYPHDQPKIPRMMVVLDEGKIAKAISRTEMSPINRISTEARKFGLGMMFGVQSSDHLTEDVRRGCGLTIVLPVHPTDIGNTTRLFQINQDDLRKLRAKSDGLVYMRAGRFLTTHLFAP